MKPQRPRIGVLDDDADLCKLLSVILRKDYDVLLARDGSALRRLVDREKIDLILLDIGLPDEDGISIARQIRTTSGIPVVFLSGFSSDDMIVKGLNIGADDYVTKPFQAEVLLARIRNALRRGPAPPRRSAPQQIRLGEWTLDVAQQNLVNQDGRSVKLTEMEARILSVLASADNQTLSRDEIFRRVHGRNWDPQDRSLEVHLSHLRKKLSAGRTGETPIVGIRGVGYRLNMVLTKAT